MIIGVTGTRQGMTGKQMEEVYNFFCGLHDLAELHHGDCFGADEQVAYIAQELGFKTVAHPPFKSVLRANHPSDIILPPADYLVRDRDIVHAVELLLVVPSGKWKAHSGTWYTHDYAVKYGTPVKLFWPVHEE